MSRRAAAALARGALARRAPAQYKQFMSCAAAAAWRSPRRVRALCLLAMVLALGVAGVWPANAAAVSSPLNEPPAQPRDNGPLLYAYNKQNPRPYAPPAPTPLKPGKSLRRPPGALAHRRQHRTASQMLNQQVLVSLVGLLALIVGAEWVAATLHLPVALLVVALGVLAGPATNLINLDALFGDLLLPLMALALAVILFEDSLRVRFADMRSARSQLVSSITIGLLVACGVAAAAGHLLLNLPLPLALLLGAAVAVAAPRRAAEPLADADERGLRDVLRREAVLLELSGSVLVVLVFQGVLFGTAPYPQDALLVVINTVWIGGVAGLVGAAVTGVLLANDRVPESLRRALTLTLLLFVFMSAELLQATAGFIAVIAMGLTLANWKPQNRQPSVIGPLGLSTALLAVVATRLQPADLEQFDAASLAFLAAVTLLARPLAVGLCTLRTPWTWGERARFACLAPRGAVAAALATICALRLDEVGMPHAGEVVPLVLLVVFGTSALDAVAAQFLQRAVPPAVVASAERPVASRGELGL